MSELKVTKVKISNILGISELEFSPGGFTEVSGKNGAGKTSVLEAIKSVVKGGADATLLRKGEEQGQVVLVLDNGMTITKKVTKTRNETSVERDGMTSSRPAETVRALADLLSVNPVDFLRATKKERVNVLLESMPMPTDVFKLGELTNTDASWVEGLHALDAITQLHKQIFDERTGVNRAAKEKAATVKQLEDTLPTGSQTHDAADLDSLRLRLREIEARKDQEMSRIKTKLEGIRTEHLSRLESIRAQHAAELEQIRQRHTQEISLEQAGFADLENKARAQEQKTTTQYHADRSGFDAQISAAEAIQGQAAKTEQTRQTIKMMQANVDKLTSESAEKTEALAALEAYKNELLSSLPIPGLEVRGGEIFRNDVPFDRLNTAQQVQVAVELAKLRAGKLGLICVDGIELLDGQAYEEFKQQAVNSGLQMIVARVADDEFSVKTGEK